MAIQTTNERLLYSQGGLEGGQFGYQGLPPEEALAQRALARKQQIANIMMLRGQEQAGQNNGQMVGRFYVPGSPWQNVAGLAQMGAGLYGSQRYDQQSEDLQTQQGAMRAQALEDYIQKTQPQQIPEHALPQGSPAVPASPGNLSDVLGDAHPAMGTPQMRQAPIGMANRLFPSAPPAEPPVDSQPPTEAQAAVPATEGPVTPAMTIQPDPMAVKKVQAQLATSTDPYLRQYAMAERLSQAQAAEHALTRAQMASQQDIAHQDRVATLANTAAYQRAMLGNKVTGGMDAMDTILGAAGIEKGSPEYLSMMKIYAESQARKGAPSAGSDIQLQNTDTGIMRVHKGTGQTEALMAPDQKTPLQPMEVRPAVTIMVDPVTGEPQPVAVGRGGKTTPLPGTAFHGSTADSQIKLRTANEKEFVDGTAGKSLRSVNVAHDHLDTWQKAADALANGDSQGFNKVANLIGKQFGVAAPTNLEGVASIVAPEIVKAIVPGGGGEAERQALEKHLGTALSPGQATGIADQYRALMMGQAQGLHRQYLSGAGATEENWKKKLSPQLQRRMAEADAAAAASSSPGTVAPFDDAEKERRYQAFKANHK